MQKTFCVFENIKNNFVSELIIFAFIPDIHIFDYKIFGCFDSNFRGDVAVTQTFQHILIQTLFCRCNCFIEAPSD